MCPSDKRLLSLDKLLYCETGRQPWWCHWSGNSSPLCCYWGGTYWGLYSRWPGNHWWDIIQTPPSLTGVRLPHLEELWQQILHSPHSLSPGWKGVESLMKVPTPRYNGEDMEHIMIDCIHILMLIPWTVHLQIRRSQTRNGLWLQLQNCH